MTNFEFYKDEIKKVVDRGFNFAFSNGKILPCLVREIKCTDCEFCERPISCAESKMIWLFSDHEEEKPKLTKKERLFCELMESGGISRDVDGNLYFNQFINGTTYTRHIGIYNLDNTSFSFIECCKIWYIEDLLLLEVES